MRITNLTRRRGAKSTALLSAAVLAASGIVATMGAANAVVTPGGGENANGVPNFYKDAQGMALALCTDPGATEARCGAADGGAVDGHFGTYFEAATSLGGAANPVLDAGWAIEAVQDEVTGEALVFNATRFRLDGLRPNTRYKITDPWGTRFCRTDASGAADCKFESNGDFSSVRTGHISTFLRVIGPNGGAFIGPDAATRVTGSRTGFNKVVMTGGGRTWSTNRFTLVGQKRANTAMSSLSKRALELGNGRQADAVTKAIRYSSFGTAAARPTVRKGGANPGAFSVRDTCASQAPGSKCQIMVTFVPRQNANSVKRAVLTINDNSSAAPRKVSLKGVGLR
jgi:hypothetical protein